MENGGWNGAIKSHPSGFTIKIDVMPGASKVVMPYGNNKWRASVEVRLTAQAMSGRANEQLIEVVSTFFGVEKKAVEIITGHRSHHKVLLILGISPAEGLDRLNAALCDFKDAGSKDRRKSGR
jgi:uncharacterized protein (TIGR00251 family)